MTRAVLYARVSGDDRAKEGRNLKGQLDMGREYARARAYGIVAELAEDESGASGADLHLPQLDRIFDMARASEFDVLIVREMDRLARDLAKQLLVEAELKACGVRIEYVLGEYPDTPEGNLQKHIKASVAEYERLKITERFVRGRVLRVKAGSVLVFGRPPYGYHLTKRESKWALEIHEPEARVVRQVFAWYTVGDGSSGPMTITAIGQKLTSLGEPTFADTGTRGRFRGKTKNSIGEWTRSVVFQLLSNETYAGVWRYGKRSKRDGKLVRNPNDRTIAVAVPSIVSREVWESAQRQLHRNRTDTRRNKKYDYLLAHRVVCGDCSLRMCGHGIKSRNKLYLYYSCPGTDKGLYPTRRCRSPYFSATEIDVKVWEWVKSLIMDPEALVNGLVAYNEKSEDDTEPLRAQLGDIEVRIADRRAQIERLLDLYQVGQLSKGKYLKRTGKLESAIAESELERSRLLKAIKAMSHTKEQIETVLQLATKASQGLEVADKDFAERRRIIEFLNVGATLKIEGSEEVAHARVVFGEDVLPINSLSVVL